MSEKKIQFYAKRCSVAECDLHTWQHMTHDGEADRCSNLAQDTSRPTKTFTFRGKINRSKIVTGVKPVIPRRPLWLCATTFAFFMQNQFCKDFRPQAQQHFNWQLREVSRCRRWPLFFPRPRLSQPFDLESNVMSNGRICLSVHPFRCIDELTDFCQTTDTCLE